MRMSWIAHPQELPTLHMLRHPLSPAKRNECSNAIKTPRRLGVTRQRLSKAEQTSLHGGFFVQHPCQSHSLSH